jgi:hypothetical protein
MVMIPASAVEVFPLLPLLPALTTELPVPHAVIQPKLIVAAMHTIQTEGRRRRLRPTKHKLSAKVDMAMDPKGGRRSGSSFLAVVFAARVSVVEAAAPDGFTVAGEKLHDVPGGKPAQLNETAELNPFIGVIVRATVPLCPAATVSVPGDTANEKSGTGRLRM